MFVCSCVRGRLSPETVTGSASGATRSSGSSSVATIAVRYVIKYFSLCSVYVQCNSFATLTFYYNTFPPLPSVWETRMCYVFFQQEGTCWYLQNGVSFSLLLFCSLCTLSSSVLLFVRSVPLPPLVFSPPHCPPFHISNVTHSSNSPPSCSLFLLAFFQSRYLLYPGTMGGRSASRKRDEGNDEGTSM